MKNCKKCKAFVMALPRITAGLLFLVAGISKIATMGVAGFAAGAIVPNFGITGGLALFVAWLVIIGEIAGGAALLAGKLIPTKIYKGLISVLIVIMLGAILMVHLRHGDIIGALMGLVILAVLKSVCMTAPICPMGITGKKCDSGTCEM